MFLRQPKSHVILALDVANQDECYRVMDQCSDLIDAVKFNYPLVLKEGISILSKVKKKYDLPIVADFKVADVPVTNNKILKLAMEAGADAILVHGFIGVDAIQEMMEEAVNRIGIIVVTELTHPGGLDFTADHASDFARIAAALDCYGIQAPGTRPEKIQHLRSVVGDDKIIVSCGVGKQGGEFQKVIAAGANYAIIGRAIYQSKSPRDSLIGLLGNRDHQSAQQISA